MAGNETVGTVEVRGVVYELDWLFEWDEDGPTDVRSTVVMVYRDGGQVAEFIHPDNPLGFRDADEVLELGWVYLSTVWEDRPLGVSFDGMGGPPVA